ncbi:hypothetical protein [Thalassotalea sp. ND16A]|uniref:hypothetical protein n=1 Tax=Thalassotalea sp. ND16A TaxID=1535422 RepID=UPI00051D4D5F|nr:hypothetical protein [Thalassotalea sp. ND16A]KGK00129.1 hypothetical protein ND16A_0320 [Thalassotalea sp. ND16A]
MGIAFLLAINFICIFICYFFAKWRKANAGYWAIMGALLGPIALPFILFAKPKGEQSTD